MATKTAQNKQIEDAFAPVMAYNALVINAAEKAVGLQVAMMQKLTKVGFDNFKAVMDIKSADELKTYAEKQQTVAKEVVEIVTEDARDLGELNQNLLEESRKLVENNIKLATAKAA